MINQPIIRSSAVISAYSFNFLNKQKQLIISTSSAINVYEQTSQIYIHKFCIPLDKLIYYVEPIIQDDVSYLIAFTQSCIYQIYFENNTIVKKEFTLLNNKLSQCLDKLYVTTSKDFSMMFIYSSSTQILLSGKSNQSQFFDSVFPLCYSLLQIELQVTQKTTHIAFLFQDLLHLIHFQTFQLQQGKPILQFSKDFKNAHRFIFLDSSADVLVLCSENSKHVNLSSQTVNDFAAPLLQPVCECQNNDRNVLVPDINGNLIYFELSNPTQLVIQVSVICQLPVASSVVYLANNKYFIGSCAGDSFIILIQPNKDVNLIQKIPGIAPIHDIISNPVLQYQHQKLYELKFGTSQLNQLGTDIILNTGMEKSSSIKRLSKSYKFNIINQIEMGKDYSIQTILAVAPTNFLITVKHLPSKASIQFQAHLEQDNIIIDDIIKTALGYSQQACALTDSSVLFFDDVNSEIFQFSKDKKIKVAEQSFRELMKFDGCVVGYCISPDKNSIVLIASDGTLGIFSFNIQKGLQLNQIVDIHEVFDDKFQRVVRVAINNKRDLVIQLEFVPYLFVLRKEKEYQLIDYHKLLLKEQNVEQYFDQIVITGHDDLNYHSCFENGWVFCPISHQQALIGCSCLDLLFHGNDVFCSHYDGMVVKYEITDNYCSKIQILQKFNQPVQVFVLDQCVYFSNSDVSFIFEEASQQVIDIYENIRIVDKLNDNKYLGYMQDKIYILEGRQQVTKVKSVALNGLCIQMSAFQEFIVCGLVNTQNIDITSPHVAEIQFVEEFGQLQIGSQQDAQIINKQYINGILLLNQQLLDIATYEQLDIDEQITQIVCGNFGNENLIIFATVNQQEKSRLVALKVVKSGSSYSFIKYAELGNCGQIFAVSKYCNNRIVISNLNAVLVLEIGQITHSDMKQQFGYQNLELQFQFICTGYYQNNVMITNLDTSQNQIVSCCLMKGLMVTAEKQQSKLRSVFSGFKQYFKKIQASCLCCTISGKILISDISGKVYLFAIDAKECLVLIKEFDIGEQVLCMKPVNQVCDLAQADSLIIEEAVMYGTKGGQVGLFWIQK